MSIAGPPLVTAGAAVTLRQIDWETYERLRDQKINRGVRMTYDHGVLHLMSPSRKHERIAEVLGQFIVAWTDHKQLPRLSGGSTTMQSELLERGLEPDKCYYIQNEAAVRHRDAYDPYVDPPPDLAVEVDITSSSAAKLPIYAAFKVPEVWRWVDEKLEIHSLDGDEYVSANGSTILIGFPIDVAAGLLAKRTEVSETELFAEFRRSF